MASEPRIIFCDDSKLVVRRAYRELLRRGVFGLIRAGLVNNYLTRRRLSRASTKAFLRLINIEPTNYCNQKCKFCLTGLGTNERPKGKMDFDTFKRTVQHLSPHTSILLAGFGEPFLNENLELFLEHAATLGLSQQLQIYSNFGAISEERIRNLLDYQFEKLIISLDSMSKRTFIEYKGCDEFDRVFSNIQILSEEAQKRKRISQQLIVQMVVTEKNVSESELFIDTMRRLKLIPRLKQLNVHNSFADKQKISEFEVRDLSRYSNSGYFRTCEWVWGGMMVLWNGDATICCQDAGGRQVYGNANTQNTDELLNTATGRCEFRKKYFDDPGQIEICRKCDVA
jgi:MoaA/NifB/PqqE/SkfB family radical SAM enzyme